MNNDSKEENTAAGVGAMLHKPHGGAVPATQEDTASGAWYVAVVKGRNEVRCHQLLSDLPDRIGYPIESYVASQQELHFYANRTRRLVERVVIPGKVFIRVDQKHRVDVLKQCPLISHYMMDAARDLRNGFRNFAQVPDRELSQLRDLLAIADAPVEYSETRPRKGDNIQVLSGRFHGMKGSIIDDRGSKYVTVILDSLGTFRFKLPVKDIGKIQ